MMQNNPFPYSNTEKRYHTLNYHLREHFGHKVFKVALDGGFDCPNRDGTVAHGGCTFCSAAGSGDFAGNRADDLITQFHDIKTVCTKMEGRQIHRLFSGFHQHARAR